jgi:hypothetical protein
MRNYILLFFSSIVFTGCQQNSNNYFATSCNNGTIASRHANISFDLKPAYNLPLDDSTVVDPFTPIQYVATSNSLIVLDHVFQRLVFYDLNNQKRHQCINIKDANLKNIKASAFKYNSPDSILLYSRNKQTFYVINHTGKIYIEKNFIKPASHTSYATNPNPFVATFSGMYFNKNEIISTGFTMGENTQVLAGNRLVKISTGLANDESSFAVKYPQIYDAANWGGSYYRVFYTTNYNDTLLISFPAEHRLVMVDKNNNVTYHNGTYPKSFCINSMNIPIDSMYKKGFEDLIDDHYAANFSYRNIIYLPKYKLYVRVLELPLKKSQLHKKLEAEKQPLLLFFDNKFNYLTNYQLPLNCSLNNYFITDKGIYFLNKLNKNENLAQYSLLQITVN